MTLHVDPVDLVVEGVHFHNGQLEHPHEVAVLAASSSSTDLLLLLLIITEAQDLQWLDFKVTDTGGRARSGMSRVSAAVAVQTGSRRRRSDRARTGSLLQGSLDAALALAVGKSQG